MNPWKLLYPIGAVALFAGLARLRSGWLGAAEAAAAPSRAVTSAAWGLRHDEAGPWWSFLRQR